ncbi:NADPH2 dehydrogenase [Microvirga lupini]|uniref:NADPH2 dehydrogenase n=1 Tax=Microvirga lupini TaxID=420324 RepID=A0A7W4VJ22_9HYPH|nr:NADH:flavin oxidoreductase/NADH oxidase [Microvirga lupini]MBB3018115.1 NADPH2 dehydrogenase [Microvirga lupini]
MSKLFSGISLGGLRLDNRVAVSPMCQYSAVNGVAQDWHLIHLGSLALSGAGLVIAEATAVEAAGRITHGCLGLWNDEQEEALARIVRATKAYSHAALGIQLGHAGRRASCQSISTRSTREWLDIGEGAWQTYGPSATSYNEGWHTPVEMTESDILRVITAFAQAARRADRAGFDLIEIHGAHGYLIHQFMSPLTNKRTDTWGGSLDNRLRFALEVARAVRSVWPQSKALGFRVNSKDWHPDGLSLDDAIVLCQALKEIGVDYAVMSAGNLVPDAKIPRATPGHQVAFAMRVKKETGLTAMAVGFIVDPKLADDIIMEGRADMVAIGRAFLDNPRWALHAAATLGVDPDYPPQYVRIRPNNWIGFTTAHPGVVAPQTFKQADRPQSTTWDRPSAESKK